MCLVLVALRVLAVVPLSSGVSDVWLWHGGERSRGFLGVAEFLGPGVVVSAIVLKFSSRGWVVSCAVGERFRFMSGVLVSVGVWIGSRVVKIFIWVGVLLG